MIIIKSDREIECMRRAGKVAAMTLTVIEDVIKPGIAIKKNKKKIVHGIPGERVLHKSNIVSADNSLSAHYESSMTIMGDDPDILTMM